MLKHQPKTLAKTLSFIGYRSPAEFGLFWDPDGTMPWKEFYWALQEDPGLRFVREATLKELALLGIDMPFVLDGRLLRLAPGADLPSHPPAAEVPGRLYYGIKPNILARAQEFGLNPAGRGFLPVCADRELAVRIARRREPEPVVVEILGRSALESGIPFLAAGPGLYLVGRIPPEFLIFPLVRTSVPEKSARQKPAPAPKPAPPAPGTFVVRPQYVQPVQAPGEKSTTHGGKKDNKGGWKKGSRKERHKREI